MHSWKPPLLHLFGLTGAGKSYAARLLEARLGYFVYEADADFTERMRAATQRAETFTDDMRDEFYTKVAARLEMLAEDHPLVVMPQAAYKNRHRDFLRSKLPNLCQVWVRASDELIEERVRARGGEVTPEYSRRVKLFFEPPAPGMREIFNDGGGEELMVRFQALFAALAP